MGCQESKGEGLKQKDGVIAEPVVSVSSVDMSDEHFTQHQKNILRETWQLVDGENHGIAIFLLIFERKPEAKELFPFDGVSGDALVHNCAFRAHAKRFMHVLGTTIDNLDALEVALIPILFRLGATHGWIGGFREQFLPVFIASIVHVITQELSTAPTAPAATQDIREAWSRLGDFLSEQLNKGYQQQLEKTSIDGKTTEPK